MPMLPEEMNPYTGVTPFDILGVSPSATSREILQARDEKLEDLDYSHKGEERILERQRIMAAYEQLNDARTRVSVEMFFFDDTVGKTEVIEAAKQEAEAVPDVRPVLDTNADVFPTSPPVDHAPSQGRKLLLNHSTALDTDSVPFSVDAAEEALQSIAYDR